MLEFRDITLDDKDWMKELLARRHYMSCEYSFGNHFIWQEAYKEQVCRVNDYYIVKMKNDEGEMGTSFLYPAGTGEIRPVIEAVLEYCEAKGHVLRFHSAAPEDQEILEREFPGKFEFIDHRDYADYIYLREDLVNLSGKKYHGKRNHISRFKAANHWKFEPLCDDNFEECMAMNREWCAQNEAEIGEDAGINAERAAVRRAFAYFKELDLFGGLLRVDDRIVAYTIGERLNEDTVVVHIEKAFWDVEGAYPMINREFLANLCGEYTYVNREEDLGIEGLRKAKLSYRPAMLYPKIEVRIKR